MLTSEQRKQSSYRFDGGTLLEIAQSPCVWLLFSNAYGHFLFSKFADAWNIIAYGANRILSCVA